MSTNFTILHLSDSHIGNPKSELNNFLIYQPLFDDINKVTTEGYKPDLVVFSGDLVFGEIEETHLDKQLIKAKEWIDEIYNSLGSLFKNIPFVIVPGNHDMDRLNRDIAHDSWMEAISNKEILYNEMRDNSVVWKGILKRQEKWAEFVKDLCGEYVKFDNDLNLSTMKIKHSQGDIGIAAFNSSWASYKKNDSKLWIGQFQVEKALNALSDCKFKIAVSHYPSSCLNDLERSWVTQKLESHFRIHLHGHIHDQWYNDSTQHLSVASGSCYQGSDKENAYSWLVIDFEQKKGKILLRKYEDKGEGGWEPFVIKGKTDNGGIGQIRNLFTPKGDEILSSEPSKTVPKVDKIKGELHGLIFSDIITIEDFIRVLQDRYSFRWEPTSFLSSCSPVTVYWPVRLRQPTPIHAVQCFVAAGLQKLGAKIVLSLDDLGNIEVSKDEFCVAIQKWMSKVGGDYSALSIRLCSKTITNPTDVWNLLQTWFASSQVNMEEVLLVSKLLKNDEISTIKIPDLGIRSPKRLMTPAIVWACLVSLYNEDPSSRLLTLGGFDEKQLWTTWRRKANQIHGVSCGHLYIPELYSPESSLSEALRMSNINLKLDWDAEDDIRDTFIKEVKRTKPPELFSPNRIIPWCFSGCFLLPSFLAGKDSIISFDSSKISSVDELKDLQDFEKMIGPLAKAICNWIL